MDGGTLVRTMDSGKWAELEATVTRLYAAVASTCSTESLSRFGAVHTQAEASPAFPYRSVWLQLDELVCCNKKALWSSERGFWLDYAGRRSSRYCFDLFVYYCP